MTTLRIISFSLGALLVWSAMTVYAYFTQEVIYSQDIPPNIVCIYDTIPEGYICIPDEDLPWYLPKPEARTLTTNALLIPPA